MQSTICFRSQFRVRRGSCGRTAGLLIGFAGTLFNCAVNAADAAAPVAGTNNPQASAATVNPPSGANTANAASNKPAASSTTNSASLAETIVHLYYEVRGYQELESPQGPTQAQTPMSTPLCSAPRAQLRVGADDGKTLTVAIDRETALTNDNDPPKKATNQRKKTRRISDEEGKDENGKDGGACSGHYVKELRQYTIDKSLVLDASPTIQGFVSGVLAVPFKYHIADRSLTAGSTIGGYVGYRTSVANAFAITPVVGGGLALISTASVQVTSASTTTNSTSTQTGSTQTSAGMSIATGLIGSVTSAASKGAQFGVLVGVDWLGKSAKYAFEGKPWIAFEIGYNFAL